MREIYTNREEALAKATSDVLSRAKHNLEQLAFVGIQDELREGVATLLRIWIGTDLLELPNLNRTIERLASHVLDTDTHRLIDESNWLAPQITSFSLMPMGCGLRYSRLGAPRSCALVFHNHSNDRADRGDRLSINSIAAGKTDDSRSDLHGIR